MATDCTISFDLDPLRDSMARLSRLLQERPDLTAAFSAEFRSPADLVQSKPLRPGLMCAMPSYAFGEFLARNGAVRR